MSTAGVLGALHQAKLNMSQKYNRYAIKCHSCENGLVDGPEDNNGFTPRVNCRWCYRGTITIVLNAQDEQKLLAELQDARDRR